MVYATGNDGYSNNRRTFFPIFAAEFALKRGEEQPALNIYDQLVKKYNLPNINHRALEVALQLEDSQIALNIAEQWVKRYPNDVPATFYLAHLALRNQQYQLAANTLDKILTLDPNADLGEILENIYPESEQDRHTLLQALEKINKQNNPSLLVIIAGLEAQNGQFDSALDKVNLALKQQPNTTSFILLKANLLLASHAEKEAFKWLDKISLKQKDSDVALFEVQQLIRHHHTQLALDKLKKMLKKWENEQQLIFLAGITSIDLKQYEQAEKYLYQLIHSTTYRDQAHYYLAINAERKQDFTTAIEHYKAVEGNLYTVSRKNLITIYMAANSQSDAIRYLTQERISHPQQASFLYQLQAQLLESIGLRQRAIHLLDEALTQMPDDAELIYAQVVLLDPFQDREQLDKSLNKLLQIEPNSPTFLNAYAYTLATQNRKLDLARKYAEQALSYAPRQASILDTLGFIAFLQNDIPTAIKILGEAYHLSPTLNIGIRYARALYLHGDMETFTIISQQLFKQYPDNPDVIMLQKLIMPLSTHQVSYL